MRKLFLIAFAWLAMVSIAATLMPSIRAESIESRTRWIGYTFKGTDSYYGSDVVAYRAGSTATLVVAVKNTYGVPINISTVGVSFDWPKPAAGWYKSTQASETNSVALENDETRYFTVNFTTPDIVTASAVLHDYTIYAEFVESTGGSLQRWNETRAVLFGYDRQFFVVYSGDQAEARQTADTIYGIKEALGTPVMWSSAKASLLWKRAMNETSIADYYYDLGNFANSKSHYSAGLSFISQAFDAEQSRGVSLEDAEIRSAEAQAKYFDALANMFNGLSSMWTLLGVALVLFAIGYIIRGFAAFRKPVAHV